MIFRNLAASIGPRRRIVASLAATALAASLVPPALAQAPKAKAPLRAAPPNGAAAAPKAQQQIQLIYAPWTKFCLKGKGPNAKQVCFTGKDGRIESGQPVIAAVLIEPQDGGKKILRVTLPLGMQLGDGTRIIIDSHPPLRSPYVICFANGCMSDYSATPELMGELKTGKNLIVQAINANGSPLTLPLPLQEAGGGFAKANEGPPTDPKKFEQAQKKLQQELQKRAEAARKKLEAASQGPGAGTSGK
ncbi:MAG: invasion associated locus B family protein [Bradyrhizobium sp.]